MYRVEITENEAGQRLDKYLHKYMKEAPSSFFYKMMRKKNITLNGGKATGNEILNNADQIEFFLSKETFEKFRGLSKDNDSYSQYEKAFEILKDIIIVAEEQDVLFLNKPSGVLSQKAQKEDISANEWLIGYLLYSKQITKEELQTFHPSVCNRLDRNTSGLLICSKTLAGSQEISKLLADRSMHKFYRCLVKGNTISEGIQEGYLYKDERNNKVKIFKTEEMAPKEYRKDLKAIRTGIQCIASSNNISELEIELFTGKSHQIRAQLALLGFPILGDLKYGGENDVSRRKKESGQLLHAYRIAFPKMTGALSYLSEREIICPKPEVFQKFF